MEVCSLVASSGSLGFQVAAWGGYEQAGANVFMVGLLGNI